LLAQLPSLLMPGSPVFLIGQQPAGGLMLFLVALELVANSRKPAIIVTANIS